ncbi:MAG: beta-ketoacyl-ACP reductase [Phycisphaerales bacterium]|nr:beta-ketoacyl-ACP reductase [Phycisphaerales bacterium]
MQLKGKVALVTGGSRGIGRAICTALAAEGADVAVNYFRNDEAAAETVRMVGALSVRTKAYKANVGDDDQNHQMIEDVVKDFGRIDILVNNAGITRDRSFAKMTQELWREVVDVNLTGQAMITHEALKHMVNYGWGRVIFITSVVGQMGNFGQSNYAVAKGGLIALVKTLAREFARKNITVNGVAPGYVETDMTSGVPESVIQSVCQMTPVGRLGKPEEVAEAVRFLALPGASYITGEVLNVNGGMYMG